MIRMADIVFQEWDKGKIGWRVEDLVANSP